MIGLLRVASAAFFFALSSAAFAQSSGSVTQHALPIGKGPGVAGFGSLLLGSGQLAIGQTSADPTANTLSGDVTMGATGVTAIGANKVTNAQLRTSGALALIGRSANTTGNVADIQATAGSSCVFVESASTLTCAQIVAANIAANAVTNAKLATSAAYTLKGNATGSTATPTDIDVTALTSKASPVSADIVLIQDSAASNAMKKTTVGALATAGSVASFNGMTGAVVVPVNGFVNKLRNSSLTSWFHGSGSLTITTSGGWGAEGIYIVPTGASVTAVQIANGLSSPLTFWAQKITGNTSVTDVTTRFVIESYDAAPLAGQQVTCQIPIINNTGASITPTLTVKRANAQDATYTNTDVSAASLQTIANGATGTLAYSWAANASSFNGLSIDVDFGNNFSANTKSVQIGGGFDCRVTPGVSTGAVASPPSPEIRTAPDDIVWNQRFYETSYDNGTVPGTATHLGMTPTGPASISNDAASFRFGVPKRGLPSLSYWDGAGTANSMSHASGGTYVDGNGTLAVITGGISTRGATFQNGVGVTNYTLFVHFAADATLTGG